MAGTAVTQAPLRGPVLTGGGGGSILSNRINQLDVNDLRIAMVMGRLTLHVRGQVKTDALEFVSLCLSLARGIDLFIANHEFPSSAQELPSLAKQVCLSKNDSFLQAAIMVLMISVKSACQCGWFLDKDSEELQNLAKEILDGFGSGSHLNGVPSCFHSVVSTVMSRFYPRMKMGQVFVFLEVKPGFEAYVSDFEIPKNLKTTSPGDKIMLFVVQTDNIETSSCLISPAKVNFLLNGKGVEKRTNLFVDNGPQTPTTVTNLLKYGPNLFQAVGEFNGNYIIGVAIMSEMPNLDSNVLQDYEQHAPGTVDSDSEIIEGPSRISLNCPISFRRIETPVKGQLCKHIQCFDFDNYVEMNSRRPSWRCPHCNHYVCFTDLRIDKKMVKVLKEAEPNISDIIISPDGPWTGVMRNDDANQMMPNSPQTDNLMDLTRTDGIDFIIANRTKKRKIPENISQSHSTAQTTILAEPHIANTDNDANQINAYTDYGPSDGQIAPDCSNHIVSPPPPPVLRTDTFITKKQVDDLSTNTVHVQQQYQFGNSNFTAEYGRVPYLPRNVTRVPTAVQALPAQPPNSVLPRCSSSSSSRLGAMQNSCSAIRANQHQVSQMSSSRLHQYLGLQENHSFSSVHHSQQIIGRPDTNQEHQRINQQTPRLPTVQSSVHSSSNFFQSQRTPMVMGPTNITMQSAYSMNPNTFQTPSMTDHRNNAGITSPPLMSTDAHDQNWRPAGRMRGALSGQAYTEAYNLFMNQINLMRQN